MIGAIAAAISTWRKARLLIQWIVLALAAVQGSPASAMSVTPVQAEMTSVGAGGRTQITVTNDSQQPLPVEAAIQALALDENGERRLSTAGEDFLIFPPQALIPPGGTQVFRVQWVGEPLLGESQSYMLTMTQVPVRLPRGQSAVQIVMSFGVLINVAPPQGLPRLAVVGSGLIRDAKTGKRYPTITVQNPSKVHALLPQSRIHVSSGSWSQTLDEPVLSQRLGIGLVQPGKRRRFILPMEVPASVTQVTTALEFKPKR